MEWKTVHHPKSSSSSSAAISNRSFSSSLLDSIYRSMDEEGCDSKMPEELAFYTGLSLTAKERSCYREKDYGAEETLEKSWLIMDKSGSTVKAAASGRKSLSAILLSSNSNSSCSSSSDSSFWSGSLSSSESDSFYCPKSTSSSSSFSCYSLKRPDPVWTERNSKSKTLSPSREKLKKPPPHHDHEEAPAKIKKSRAMKIYAELKKAKSKQPVSPGSRVASFLNSLFANTKKKAKMAMEHGQTSDEKMISHKLEYAKSKSTPTSCPSSASSFTRSCLSKTLTLPSQSKNIVGKRSVRFDTVSVIVDEDTQPRGSKFNLGEEDELKKHVTAENGRVAEAARRLLEGYRRNKVSSDSGGGDLSEDDEYVNDGGSCSSSDLFELGNLSEIGIDRPYRDELPVYETTRIDANRAIASGLTL
ncbi:hypothetical protein SAY87_016450 [Trapa incisa]|uniref:Protein BIG GRAIN 1-like A n=1 Tax=Trapa incisa TaxID=236973 RepID=A0AAN7LA26_9MYRT|nr:hypothetical protein SAY87_016450 [Trapa incisa]